MTHSLHVAAARVPFPVTVTLSNVMPEMTESFSPSQSRLPFVALANGAAPALTTLNLMINEIGDEGARHLGDALARGAAPALKDLWLSGNPASDDAKQAVRDALKQVRPDFQIL